MRQEATVRTVSELVAREIAELETQAEQTDGACCPAALRARRLARIQSDLLILWTHAARDRWLLGLVAWLVVAWGLRAARATRRRGAGTSSGPRPR